jgi:phytoene synthase
MTRILLEELPAAQRLALAYAPAIARRPTLALLALDARLGAILRRQREPLLGQMRLAWWRDSLRSEPDGWPAGEPVLDLLRGWRCPAALLALVDGWEALLGERLDRRAIGDFADGRAAGFGALASELGVDSEPAMTCARLWALADLAANLSDAGERAAAIDSALLVTCPRLPRALRSLAVLAGLAHRSLARGGAPLLDGPAGTIRAVRLGIMGR